MKRIASPANPRLRWLARLAGDRRARRREGLWVLEGVRLAEEVLAEKLAVRLWLVEEGFGARGEREARLLERLQASGAEAVAAKRGVVQAAADTQTPQGVLAVVEAPRWTVDDVFGSTGPVVLLDRVQDPGNLGTVCRTAEAAGAAGLLLTPGGVDPGNPKALRASAGSLLRLPVVVAEEDPVAVARAAGRVVWATTGTGGTPYTEPDYRQPFALLLGREGSGASPELLAAADGRLTVPMAGRVESLNVAGAAAVILFEAARQRSLAGP